MGINETILHLASTAEEQLQLRRIADKSQQCRRQNIPTWTKFLTMRERNLADQLLPLLGSPNVCWLSGTEEGERAVLYFLPDWMEAAPTGDDSPIACVRCKYAAEYGTIGHRDFLGALMSLGVERETLGDIYPSPGSADLVILRDMLPYLMQNFISAGRVHLQLSEVNLEEILVPERQTRLIRDTVSTLRLDSVVSSAFSMSRDKAATLVRSGRVQVDHAECTKPDKLLQQGAVLSIRGFGRAILSETGGLSKKGRIGIVITRYLD